MSASPSVQEIATEASGSLVPIQPEDTGAALNAGVQTFIFSITDHHGFDRSLNLAGVVSSSSRVFVSITELGVFSGQVKPFLGLASMEIHNVVPQDNGTVIVRGYIGWESNLNVRLTVLVA